MSYGNNVNSPFGFRPSQYLNGGTYNGQPNPYQLASGYATAIFTGDPVDITGGYVTIGVAGSPIVGVCAGFQYLDALGNYQYAPYWPANTVTFGAAAATVLVYDDPNILYDIQTDDSTGPHTTPYFVQADMGKNANFAIGAGNTATGQSTTYLNRTGLNTTNTLNCRLVRFTPVPGNGPGSATAKFNNVLVMLNSTRYHVGTTGN